jgi:hypothetical protein
MKFWFEYKYNFFEVASIIFIAMVLCPLSMWNLLWAFPVLVISTLINNMEGI